MVGRAGVLSPVQAGDRMAPWPALLVLALAFALAACSGPRGGGYYRDDGPGRAEPADVSAIPDAVPRHEPVRAANTRPYVALGRRYVPMTERAPYRETGVASWYGRRFHGQPTASGERYDMYAMTAAHPTLPLPSYVRVTNLSNSRSVIVRVNDRGPFLQGRLIDLSWTAAKKLDFVHHGHTRVLVEVVEPGDAPTATPTVMTAGQVERRDVAAAPVAPTNPAPVPVVPVVRAVPSTAAGTQEAAAATPTAVLGQAEETPDAPHAEETPASRPASSSCARLLPRPSRQQRHRRRKLPPPPRPPTAPCTCSLPHSSRARMPLPRSRSSANATTGSPTA